MTMHHIVSDGWSMGVMVGELAQLYEAFSKGQESPLAELPIQYADYAVWQREWLQGEVLEQQLEYWQEQLDGVAGAGAADGPGAAGGGRASRSDARGFSCRQRLTRGAEGVEPAGRRDLVHDAAGGFQVLLARYSGQEDIVVGTPIAGRNGRRSKG